jgi:hypothetical protein
VAKVVRPPECSDDSIRSGSAAELDRGSQTEQPRSAPTAALFIVALFGAGSLCVSLAQFLSPPLLYLRDFVQDWLWARALHDGLPPYEATTTLASRYLGDCCPVHLAHATPHPPLAGLLILPLSGLDLVPASLVWAAGEIACLSVAMALLTRARWPVVVGVTGALLAWHAARVEIVHGQFTLLQLLILVLVRRELTAGRESRAGALVGLALCIKPILLPLVLFFALRRQTRALLGVGAAVAAIGVFSAIAVGPAGVAAYVMELPRTGEIYRDYPLNTSLWALGGRLAPADPELGSVISVTAVALVLGALVTTILAARKWDLAYGATIAASAILNPVAWDIYMLLALIPAMQVVDSLRDRGWPRRELALAALLGIGALVPTGSEVLLLAIVPTLAVLGLASYAAVLARTAPARGVSWALLRTSP